MTRFTPRDTGFSLFVLDKRAGARQALDEPSAAVPCWRTPQPAPHNHQDHEINLVVEGSTRYEWFDETTGWRQAKVPAGSIMVIPGGVMHTVHVDSRAVVRGLWIHPSILPPSESAWHTLIVRDPALFARLGELFHQAAEEFGNPDAYSRASLSSLGRLAGYGLCRLAGTSSSLGGSSTQDRVFEVKRWLDRHYLERPTLKELALRAGLSPSRFSEVFVAVTGKSPIRYVVDCRLQHAAGLLTHSELPVGDIAILCGFSDAPGMARRFQAEFGSSPALYRKKCQETPAISHP